MPWRRVLGTLAVLAVAALVTAGTVAAVSSSSGAPAAGRSTPSATASTGSQAGPSPAADTQRTAARLPRPVRCAHCWHPAVRTSWNWVLANVPHAPYRHVRMYDVDGFEATAADVASLHHAGIKAVCYISAGSLENYRPDASKFPKRLLGRKLDGWPDERWLDIRDLQRPHSVLRRLMDARLDMCQRKKFDAVELDNVDAYTNRSGFPLTARDQLFFNETLANDVHRRGMSVLQKNDNEQIPTLLRYFDGALNEQCNQYHECTTAQTGGYGYNQYVAAHKPVFQAEYSLPTKRFCPQDNARHFNGVRFDLALNDRVFRPCR